MKKRICLIILCLAAAFACAFGLAACGTSDGSGSDNTGDGNGQEQTTPEDHTHSLSAHQANEATCTAEGNIAYWSCDCGKYFSDAEGKNEITLSSTVINKKSHTESGWILDKGATCTEKGSEHKECTVCHETLATQPIEMISHTESSLIIDKEATCTEEGSKHTECTVCHTTINTGTISKLSHTESDWLIDKQATCTEAGSKHTECIVCHEPMQGATVIPATEHHFENWICTGCGIDEFPTTIMRVEGGTIDGFDIYTFVDADIKTVALSRIVTCATNSTWKLYEDNRGQIEIPTKVAASANGELLDGNNVFYILVTSTDGAEVNLYTLTIYRSFEISINYYNGDTVIKTDKAFTGYEYIVDYTPDITGYTFNAWKNSEEVFTNAVLWGDLNLYADKTAHTFKVTFITDEKAQAIEEMTATYDEEITLPSSSKTGYTFNGWLDGGEISQTTFVWQFTEDKEYSAKFTANQYTITYIANGGTVERTTQQVTYDSEYTLYDISRLGYTFEGYTYNGELFTAGTYTIDGDIRINAEWAIITYTITYHLNGGKNAEGNPVSYNIETDMITLLSATRENHIFMGWYSDEHFNVQVTEIESGSNGNKNLYAKWNFGTEGLIFTLIGNEYWMTGYTGNASEVIIPSEYNDKVITSIGSSAFKNCMFTSIEIPDSVTSIGESAFSDCSGLTSIKIPDSVTKIGKSAFSGCICLETVYWNAENCAPKGYILSSPFGGCTALTEIIIGDNVQSIPEWMFYGCTSLESVTIGNGVTSIGDSAFGRCISLSAVYITDIESWCSISFGDSDANPLCYAHDLIINNNSLGTELIIPDTVTEIKAYAFVGCNSLTSVEIPSSVTIIGDSAFSECSSLTVYCEAEKKPSGWSSSWNTSNCPVVWNCKNNSKDANGYEYAIINGLRYALKSGSATVVGQPPLNIDNVVTVPSNVTYNDVTYSVTSIGSYAFSGCNSLKSIEIPNSVTSIGSYAFSGCSSLKSIEIPNSVTSIGGYAFSGCSSLVSITLPFVGSSATATKASDSTLFGYIFGRDNYTGGSRALQHYASGWGLSYYIPSSLREVTITGGEIFYGAFNDCSYLTSIKILNDVTSIGDFAFYGCSDLTSITIPNSVTSIGEYAFYDCSDLTNVYYTGDIASWCSISFVNIDANPVYYAHDLIINNNSLGTELIIPDTVTEIKAYAFVGCRNLTNIYISDSVTSIMEGAFSGCNSLISITLPFVGRELARSSMSMASRYSLFGYIFGTSSYAGGIGIKQYYNGTENNNGYFEIYYIPASLKEVTILGGNILSGAFYRCSGLTSITISSDVTSIGKYAFFGCSGLTSVVFNNTNGWWYASSRSATSGTSISSNDLSNSSIAATLLTSTYRDYYWKRS